MTTGYITGSSDANPVLDELIEEFASRLHTDEPIDPEAFISLHPEQAEALQQMLPVMQVLAGLDHSIGDGEAGARSNDNQTPLGQLGDFRLLQQIGRGGMGIVYEAQQISLGRRVALKVLPFAGTLDSKQLQRFKNEAHAAALLHHTNIVPVYYVGCERSVHFYAMQLIEGRPLSSLVRELRRQAGLDPTDEKHPPEHPAHESFESLSQGPVSDHAVSPHLPATVPCLIQPDLSSESGLQMPSTPPVAALSTSGSIKTQAFFRSVANLGVQAADALEHAHEMGVIHRDIKPGNLLLDVRGNLWVTDFGLAQFQNRTGPTLTGDLVGTLRYMSPEQALAKRVDLDHRTDIYSLGATLYELLTLHPVFDGRDRQELLRKIAFEEPRAPRRLNASIPADLETILLKTLFKDPHGRYASAKEMADDLRRFLQDEPIRARRPTLVQKAAKWSRRHRVVVTATVLALMAGLAATTVASWRGQLWTEQQRQVAVEERARAEARLELARQAFEEMYAQTLKWLDFEPSIAPVQQKFLTRALAFYDQLSREDGPTPAERYRTAEAYHKIAQINYRLWYTRTWNKKKNEQDVNAVNEAIVRLKRLADDYPEESLYRREIIACNLTRAEMLKLLGNAPEAESSILIAQESLERLPSSERNTRACRYQLGISHYEMGRLLANNAKRYDEADRAYQRAQGLFRALADEAEAEAKKDPEAARPEYLNHLASASAGRGWVLWAAGHVREAEQTLRQSVADLNSLVAASKLLPEFRESLGKAQFDLGFLLFNTGRARDAEAPYRKALDVYEKLAQTFPHVSRYHGNLGKTQEALVVILRQNGDFGSALAMAESAVNHQHEALAANPGDLSYNFSLQSLNREFAWVLIDLHQVQRAFKAADEVADIVPGCPVGGVNAMKLFATIVRLAEQDKQLSEDERTALVNKYLAREKEMRPRVLNGCPYMGDLFENDVAWHFATFPDVRFRNPKQAVALAKDAISKNPKSGDYWNTLGVARYRQGDWKGAIAALEKSDKFNGGRQPIDALFLSMAHWQLGQKAEARKWFDRATEILKKPGQETEEVRRFRAEAVMLLHLGSLVAG
jgi:eukaryotic-like serine/threonine-protein kinase